MIIVIDGYNLLHHVFPGAKGKLTKQRDALIRHLGFYKSKKNHEIVIVFDGGVIGRAMREIHKGIVVIESGQKSSADDWIVDYIERSKHHDFLLVSRDRELAHRCKALADVDIIDAKDFYDLIQGYVLEDVEQKLNTSRLDGVEKFEFDDNDDELELGEIDSQALDILMSQADMGTFLKDKDDSIPRQRHKKRTTPKDEKSLEQKIKKL
jgi:hypothetical protein